MILWPRTVGSAAHATHPGTGTADGIDPGYINYPAQLFKAVQDAPTNGGGVTIMVWNISQPMTPLDQNSAWQEINKQVGGDFDEVLKAWRTNGGDQVRHEFEQALAAA